MTSSRSTSSSPPTMAIWRASSRSRAGKLDPFVALTRETVAAWLRAYVRAWETYDPDAVAELFTEDATYAYHPFDEPIRGRLAIVASWLDGEDPAGTYDGLYEPVAIDVN